MRLSRHIKQSTHILKNKKIAYPMHRKYTFIIITKNILEPTFDPYPRSISTDNYRTGEEQRE